jgi:hypothetical protein
MRVVTESRNKITPKREKKAMRLIIPLIVVASALLLLAQSPVTIADISGDGAVHQIASSGTAISITFEAPAGNSTTSCTGNTLTGCVRIGDASISTSRGTYLTPGSTATLPEPGGTTRYKLSEWYYLVQTGDKLVINYVK